MTGMNFFQLRRLKNRVQTWRQMSKFLPRRIYANTFAYFGPAWLPGSHEEARKKVVSCKV